MSVRPFPTRPPFVVIPYDDPDDQLDGFDDGDETLRRYASTHRSNRLAHRVVNPSVLATITGFPVFVCEEFHHVLFGLLEAIGDFDGLIATPTVCVGRADALLTAQEWLAANACIDVDATMRDPDERFETADEVWTYVKTAFETHSLALAAAVGSNPSLTFGSAAALSERLSQDVLEITVSCMPAQIDRLTTVALDLIPRLPDVVTIVGNASRHTCLTRDTFAGWPS